jgi:hypothetical protein
MPDILPETGRCQCFGKYYEEKRWRNILKR